MKKIIPLLFCFLFTSCATLMGESSRDELEAQYQMIDQQNRMVGGAFPEANLLGRDATRSTSSYYYEPNAQNTWVDPTQVPREGYAQEMAGVSPDRMDSRSLGSVSDSRMEAASNEYSSFRSRFKNGVRATRDDFVDASQTEASLWSPDGQSNYYFTRNQIKDRGDILTLKVGDELFRDVKIEILRSLTRDELDFELMAAQRRLSEPKKPAASSEAGANQQQPAKKEETEEATARKATYADIQLDEAIDLKSGDPIMVEVLERYPNGNYKVQGMKRVGYRNSYKNIRVVAIAKEADISQQDEIDSQKLFEYRLKSENVR